ncbi:MAG: zinc ribbon domain-containing protein [Clostridia bacterium]|nr:zinc ribbon domain-containing protein [Clostridia bacterium]
MMEQKYCQSCGMPMQDENLYGSEKNGDKSTEYCLYCYENGSFKQPDLSMEQMIEICVPHMVNSSMTDEEARKILNQFLPELTRWKKS